MHAAQAFENVNAANLPGVMWYLEHEAPADSQILLLFSFIFKLVLLRWLP